MKDSLFFAGAVQKSLCVVVLVSHDKIEVVAVLENSFLVLPVARLHDDDDDDDVVARAGAAATRSTCLVLLLLLWCRLRVASVCHCQHVQALV